MNSLTCTKKPAYGWRTAKMDLAKQLLYFQQRACCRLFGGFNWASTRSLLIRLSVPFRSRLWPRICCCVHPEIIFENLAFCDATTMVVTAVSKGGWFSSFASRPLALVLNISPHATTILTLFLLHTYLSSCYILFEPVSFPLSVEQCCAVLRFGLRAWHPIEFFFLSQAAHKNCRADTKQIKNKTVFIRTRWLSSFRAKMTN